jgi:AraC-like DNA-binding protein
MLLEKLFDNLALRVDAFATCGVSRGWRLTVPGLDWAVLHFVMQGDGALRIPPGTTQKLPCYSLAVVPTGLGHDLACGREVDRSATVGDNRTPDAPVPLYAAGSTDSMELMVACGRIQAVYGAGIDLFGQLRDILIVDFSDSPKMRTTFEAVLDEQRAGGPGSGAMMSALLSQCLVMMFRRLADLPHHNLAWLDALEDPRLGRVIGAVLDRPEQPHSLEGLADLAGMSRSVFAKRFHEGLGRPPMDYVREVRLRSGARLLGRPELSVDAVAARVGFASRSHFSKAFSAQFGCSPSVFRAQQHASRRPAPP